MKTRVIETPRNAKPWGVEKYSELSGNWHTIGGGYNSKTNARAGELRLLAEQENVTFGEARRRVMAQDWGSIEL